MGPVSIAETERPGPPPPAPGGGHRWRRAVPWAVIVLWIAALALAAPFAGKLGDVQRDTAVDYLPDSADSTQVARLVEELPGGETAEMLVVYHRADGLTAQDRQTARDQAAEIAADYDIAGDTADGQPRTVPSQDGTTLLTAVSLPGLADEDERVAAVHDVRELTGEGSGGLTIAVGGGTGLEADMEEVFESVDGTVTLVTVSVVAVLLILIYRSPLLWLVPLLSVGAATTAAMALVYGLVQGFDLTVTSMSSAVMTVLVLGAGTDYALLLVARYREELRRHPAPYDAMLAALRGCGPAILASSGTVAAGLLCLLAADLNSSSGLGPVGAVGVLCALAAMTTLLPAALVLLGRWVFWPMVPSHGSEPHGRRSLFAAMGGSASRRPVTVLVAGVAVLGALALGTFQLPGDLRDEDAFVDKPASVSAMETVEAAYPEQSAQPITVIARSGEADQVLRAARDTAGVAQAEAGRAGGGWTEISVFAADPPESSGEMRTVMELRGAIDAIGEAEGAEAEGVEAYVGGRSAEKLDLASTNADDRAKVIPLTLVAVLLILIALLRSLTAPLVLVAAVVASWGAAMGLGGLVFGPLFGFDGLDPGIALISFVFLVSLGVDYGIFLMHRMREVCLTGTPVPAAADTALRTTGGVIASAGIVLAATFSVLTTMPLVMMAELGFIIAVGVLLDTFLVRTYLVTSASLLLRRWVWWPGWLFKARAR